ncbi:hypothetical protein MKQ68_24155 [Chitinophaga horti]|uniref:Tetratricopeptide repeat protein n=1 Tax=Chitinophaga horti TaxID=2920382 RepID=A0ABY6J0M3_9BACT|nr:hypothetical protein [Chitinophaga horti]UYQ93180.1 hypothetical protein MKQ68_24155 [Chitinophaga horti]
MNLFAYWHNAFVIIPILQVICIIHAYKTGRRDMIYLLIFLPGIGSLAYIVLEIVPEISRGQFLHNLQRYIFPNSLIRDLERKRQTADTVTNRLVLAEAYGEQKKYDQAIELVKSCLSDLYANDPGIVMLLARLQYHAGDYTSSIANFEKAFSSKKVFMKKAEDELAYAQALESAGSIEKAEEEYKKVVRIHHSLEGMYRYGMFLDKQRRPREAKEQFQTVIKEIGLHPRYVRRLNQKWLWLSRKQMASYKLG